MGEAFTDFFYSARDGLKLHARLYGPDNREEALPVVCLPGLTRNARDFHELALFFAGHAKRPRQVIAFDYRGRGLSAYDRDWRNYNVATEADDILQGLTALDIGAAAFVGTSRGGLIVFALAAMRPSLFRAVVLNDIGPVVDGAGLAQIRAYLERAPQPKSIAEAIAIQRSANGPGFPALGDADWERMARALYREPNGRETEGRLTADFDPALVKTMTSLDLSVPLPVLWPQFEGLGGVPLLAIRGGNSKLLSAATLEEMGRRHAGMRAIVVDGQGHAPLLETGTLPEEIAAFLEDAERR